MSTGVDETTPEAQQEVPAAPVPGTPEYDKALADKYVAANSPKQAPESTDPAPTEGSPEESPAAEGAGGLKIETQEEAPKDEAAPSEDKGEKQEEPAALIPAEMFEKASAEFAESGELTDETIESFVAKGIPREFIDTYVQGARAMQAQLVSEAHGLVGGTDNWNAMMAWAKTLPQEDVEAFNEAVVNSKTSSLAIQGLYSRFTAANGSEASSVAGDAERGALGGDVYRSKAELTTDIRDPKYKSDPAFRSSVENKIARSRKAGTLGPLGTAY